MTDDFAQLLVFHECCGSEANGHGFDMEADKSELIERFIHGQCDESERRQLAQFLQTRPQLIAHIAERMETDRPDSGGSAADASA